jgi:hypothetical protein
LSVIEADADLCCLLGTALSIRLIALATFATGMRLELAQLFCGPWVSSKKSQGIPTGWETAKEIRAWIF